MFYSEHACGELLNTFGDVTSHTGLTKTIIQGMVAGKRQRGKPGHRREKGVTNIFGIGTRTVASRIAEVLQGDLAATSSNYNRANDVAACVAADS